MLTEWRSTQCWLSEEGLNVNRVQKVNEEVSFYWVTLYLPSHQWLPSSRQLCMTSMNQAPTSTECMMMLSNVVLTEYQKVIKSTWGTRVYFTIWPTQLYFVYLCLADLASIIIEMVYMYNAFLNLMIMIWRRYVWMCDANSAAEQYIQQGSQGAERTSSITRGDLL